MNDEEKNEIIKLFEAKDRVKDAVECLKDLDNYYLKDVMMLSKVFNSLDNRFDDLTNKKMSNNKLNEISITILNASDFKLIKLLKNVDRKSTRLNSSHIPLSRMPSSA